MTPHIPNYSEITREKVKRIVLGKGFPRFSLFQQGGTYCYIYLVDENENPVTGFENEMFSPRRKIRLIAEVLG